MAKVNIFDMKEEVLILLRNADVLSVGTRGVTTSQDTGTFASDSTHTLATNPTLVKNIRNVNVASTDLVWGTDYTVNYTTGVISFTSPQTGAYVIDYDQGSTDKIFPDFPQAYLKREDFPRIAIEFTTATSGEMALGGGSNTWTDLTLNIVCYDISQKNVDEMITSVKDFVQDNKKSFYRFDFIKQLGLGPLLSSTFGETKCFQRNYVAQIPRIAES
jgi:hypothetical protein